MGEVVAFHRRSALTVTLTSLIVVTTVLRAQPCAPPIADGSGTGEVARIPAFLDAWKLKYPTSTLPDRMDTLTGRDCNVCHHPPNLNTPGNCYRDDLSILIQQGLTIEQAITQLDTEDSDGDGFSNGEEATRRRPEAGEIGYNPGLIGETGTDPCGDDPNEVVTGVPETPSSIPATSGWGLLCLVLSVLVVGTARLRSRHVVSAQR